MAKDMTGSGTNIEVIASCVLPTFQTAFEVRAAEGDHEDESGTWICGMDPFIPQLVRKTYVLFPET